MPKEYFVDFFSDALGIESRQTDVSDDFLTLESQSRDSNQINFVEDMGVMLIIAFGIIVVIGLLLLLRCLVSVNEKVRKVYLSIKQKIFYNSLCRYFLTSTLKLHIASTDTLLAVYVLSNSVPDYKVNWSKILIPFGILSVLNIVPFLYFYILRSKKS